MLYHLHTETRDNLPSIVAKYFDGATLINGQGLWNGRTEPSTTIEITTDDRRKVYQLASDIRETNQQEAVLVEAQQERHSLITADSTPQENWYSTILRRRPSKPMPEWMKAVDPVTAYFDREADID